MILSGWGRYPRMEAASWSFETNRQLADVLEHLPESIPRGLGRSYGDSALNENILLSERLDKVLAFESETGIVVCESGVSLEELIDLVLPSGWFLSVTPGTRFVTVGGAIASDVHGKNHHRDGCFSEFVLTLDLMLPNGAIVTCSRAENHELFRATCGGVGLTGVVLSATLQLRRVTSASIRYKIIRCRCLDEVFDQFERLYAATYSVAWIDCLARGARLGRSLLMIGEHDDCDDLRAPRERTWSLPINLPGFFLTEHSVRLFNRLYYARHATFQESKRVSLHSFFYPLDSIRHWNRLYGRRGFLQYQFVLPKDGSREGLEQILQRVAASGRGSFLGVLKLFGGGNANHLSFPIEGYTMALDFAFHRKLLPLLAELDQLVVGRQGRIYLSKDARVSREVFRQGYPRWAEFLSLRERYGMAPKFQSLQSKRLGI